ncbi:MAG: adenylate/guanylate cyclase domain-containing protein [Sneathiellales bacterium]|nr:adenylate/guanylate cyclase domain-containing protein [Sneathiellales bacterium]
MSTQEIKARNIDETFLEAEQAGLRLAIKGRLIALLFIGSFMVLTRLGNLALAFDLLVAVIGFSLLGVLHYRLIGSRYDRPWTKYVFVTIDFAILSYLIATQPIFDTVDVPQVIMFRNTVFPFYFVVLGMAAFGLSQWLVLWAGFAGVVGWYGAFLFAIKDMPIRFQWTDIGSTPTTEKFVSIFLSPNFVGYGSRVQESLLFLVTALLISVVIWRARQTVYRQLELDDERQTISEVFAQYVPKKIADSLIADRGLLEPVEREATVLFLDIAGFTALTERSGARQTVAILNDFFEQATTVITSHQGVVTQFIGDAVMATFNIPVEDEDHRENAIKAATEILALTETAAFAGEKLSARIGLCTGPVVGGSVGGGGRQTYTVYGNTVNLASRLEALNKSHGTTLLVAETTVPKNCHVDFTHAGKIEVRGFSEPVSVYKPK